MEGLLLIETEISTECLSGADYSNCCSEEDTLTSCENDSGHYSSNKKEESLP